MTKAWLGWAQVAVVAGGMMAGWGGVAASAQEQAAPLAGPEVTPREVPGVSGQYVEGDTGRFGGPERAVPLPVFFEALRGLGAEGAGLALTPEQAEGIRAELRAFHEELAVFLEASGDEVRALVGQLPQNERGRAVAEVRSLERMGQMIDRAERAGGFARVERGRPARREEAQRDGDPDPLADRDDGFRLRFRDRPAAVEGEPDEMMAMGEGGSVDARARLLELRGKAPSVAALQTRVWRLLAEPQREYVGAVLDEHMAEVRAAQEEQRLARDIERRKAAASDRAPSDRAPSGPGVDLGDATLDRVLRALDSGEIPERLWSRLPEQARRRIETLPEDERAAALARWLRARREGAGGGPIRKPPA